MTIGVGDIVPGDLVVFEGLCQWLGVVVYAQAERPSTTLARNVKVLWCDEPLIENESASCLLLVGRVKK